METVYEFLLNLDIDDLEQWCQTRKNIEICHDPYFWKNKFNHDDLIIFNNQKSVSDWIKEYKNVLFAINKTKQLMINVNKKIETLSDEQYIHFPNIDLSQFQSYDDIPFLSMFKNVMKNIHNKPTTIMPFIYYDDDDSDEDEIYINVDRMQFNVSIKEFEMFFINYFYYEYIRGRSDFKLYDIFIA